MRRFILTITIVAVASCAVRREPVVEFTPICANAPYGITAGEEGIGCVYRDAEHWLAVEAGEVTASFSVLYPYTVEDEVFFLGWGYRFEEIQNAVAPYAQRELACLLRRNGEVIACGERIVPPRFLMDGEPVFLVDFDGHTFVGVGSRLHGPYEEVSGLGFSGITTYPHPKSGEVQTEVVSFTREASYGGTAQLLFGSFDAVWKNGITERIYFYNAKQNGAWYAFENGIPRARSTP